MTELATQNWTIVSLKIQSEDSEPITDWIRTVLEVEPIEISRPRSPDVWIELYYEENIQGMLSQQVLTKQFPHCSCTIRGCEARDWQAFWKDHFHRQNVGKKLQIVPIWEEPDAKDRMSILLDPGLSFGTGDHFTTRFCLEQIDWIYNQETPATMLDAGTGSGILSIAAEKLGCSRIDAFDFDPLCLEYTRKNLELNQVSHIHLFEHDITQGIDGGPYDLVCANIYSKLLIGAANDLITATNRWLILTGIQEKESDEVSAAFLARGAREVVWDGNGEWCGMVFQVER